MFPIKMKLRLRKEDFKNIRYIVKNKLVNSTDLFYYSVNGSIVIRTKCII
jgi:hypothetical protein